MKFKFLFLLVLICISGFAQQDIVIGKSHKIHSNILGEERTIDISLPESYEVGDDLYPVIYLLDSRTNFEHTVSMVKFLAGNQRIPEMIVVGIQNTNRNRDLTPVSSVENSERTAWMNASGGANEFIEFIEKELMPYVEANNRTATYKILVGHSFGGLLATYSFFKSPELFDAYIAISPSLWYKNDLLDKNVESFLKENPDLNSTFYMTMADEGGSMLGGAYKLAGKFESHLEENKPENFSYKFEPMFDQDHGSIPLLSTYQGLEYIFEGFRPMGPESKEEVVSMGGPEKVINETIAHYKKISKKYGFEISSEATINQWGYVFLEESDPEFQEAALYAFQKNTENYPDSANTYDSLGDGYLEIGEVEKAKENFEKAVKIAKQTGHPVLETSQRKLEELKAGTK